MESNNIVVKEMESEVSNIEKMATDVVIASTEDYESASELTKKVKTTQTKVKEYWEPMRVSTYNAYKAVTDHKKEMLDPLEKAEKILKGKMSDWVMEQERIRREKEAELRRLAQAEMEAKLKEAEEANNANDDFAYEMAMAEAEVMENTAATATVNIPKPQAKGVSTTKAWEITNIDLSKVPVELMGMLIRPVDERAVMQLIKASKGTVQIPGITYRETVNMRVRTR